MTAFTTSFSNVFNSMIDTPIASLLVKDLDTKDTQKKELIVGAEILAHISAIFFTTFSTIAALQGASFTATMLTASIGTTLITVMIARICIALMPKLP